MREPTYFVLASLLAGGRHARAARNRSQGTAVNLRVATVLGLSSFAASITDSGRGTSWRALGVTSVGLAAGLSPWLGRRTATAVLVGLAAAPLAGVPPVLPVTAEQHLGSAYELFIGERVAIELAVIGSVMLPAAWLLRRQQAGRRPGEARTRPGEVG